MIITRVFPKQESQIMGNNVISPLVNNNSTAARLQEQCIKVFSGTYWAIVGIEVQKAINLSSVCILEI